MMKRIAPLCLLLLLAPACYGQVLQTVAARTSVTITPKSAGNTLAVQCDAVSGLAGGKVTDSSGTAFTPIGRVNGTTIQQSVFLSGPLASAATDTVACPAGEIYVVELPGAVSVDGASGLIQTNGATSTASGTLPTTAGDLVLAFCVTGTCTLPAGWTSLSTFDSNLVAWQVASGSNVVASFPVNDAWVLTLVALKPAGSAPPPPPPPSPPPAPATVVASFACTPAFLPVTMSTFVPAGAKGLTFSVMNSDAANNLVITAISPPPGFAIDAALMLPVTIAPGDSQTFTIRFVPAAAGSYSGNVVFLANVAGGNFQMGVMGTAK
jgi:hypothetical protein